MFHFTQIIVSEFLCWFLWASYLMHCLRTHRLRGSLVAHTPGKNTLSPRSRVCQPVGTKARLPWVGAGAKGLAPKPLLTPHLAWSDCGWRPWRKAGNSLSFPRSGWWGQPYLQSPLLTQPKPHPCLDKLCSPDYRRKGKFMLYAQRGKQCKYCKRPYFTS